MAKHSTLVWLPICAGAVLLSIATAAAAGSWEQVTSDGFGELQEGIFQLQEFEGELYAFTLSLYWEPGGVWRSTDGQSWSRVVDDGFGDPTNMLVYSLFVFDDWLYAGTFNHDNMGEIWRLPLNLFADGFESGNTSAWNLTVP